jgi:glucosamine-phosphate N-acetyltransferase
MDKIKFEKLKRVDSKTVKEIAVLLEKLNPDFKPPVRLSDIKKVVEFPRATVFVARETGRKIIGMITLIGYPQLEGNMKIWIEDLVVDKSYRRLGLGRKLMQIAIKEAKKLKAKSIVFTSRASRKGAQRFYKSMGFKTKETNYYRQELV